MKISKAFGRAALLAAVASFSTSTMSQSPLGNGTAAQSPAEDTALRTVQTWFELARSGEDAAYIAFLKEHWPDRPGPPESWLNGRAMLRELQPRGVASVSTTEVALWVFDPNMDSFALVTAKLSPDNPARITTSMLQLTDRVPPGAVMPARLQGQALIDASRARIDELVANNRFSGTVLLAHRGRVLFQQAFGLADREARKANTLDTQFRFGSMGKMFTAVAIMQLAQAGKVDLAAPIGRYLPAYPNSDIAAKVTVAHLLTHTGGTGDIFGPQFVANKASLRDLKDYVDLYGSRALQFEPGSRIAYSNYGFILMGRIIEHVSGLSYDDYVERHIFRPAGMRSTGHLPETTILPKRAVAYMGPNDKLARADPTLPVRGTSAGGGYSTVGDFNRFMQALLSHRVLSADSFGKLTTGGVTLPDGKLARYDFGGAMAGAGRYLGHGGGAPGMNGMLVHFPGNGYTIVVLANRDPPVADGLARFIAYRLPEPS